MTATNKGLYGVVEGFYGRPWNPAQRRTLFGWLHEGGLNAYMYAPKDDTKHRAVWRELYDFQELAALRDLVRDCQCQGLQFIYATAPGLDIRFTDAADLAALQAKLKQVRDLGVRHFAILFDDISPELTAADKQRFGTPAAAQAFAANEVLKWAAGGSGESHLLFCPTEYCGAFARPSVAESAYLRTLGEQLDPKIDVLWTGPEIISEVMPVDSIRELQRVLRRKPMLWDNLHANDYDMRRLYVGPYSGRAPELPSEITGILSNPNCQFEANFIPVRTLAAYVRDPQTYSPRAAYHEALAAWLPAFKSRGRGGALTLEGLQLAADIFYLPTEFGELAERYLADLRVILHTPPNGWGEVAVRFEQTTRQIAEVYDKATELADRDVLYALYPHLWEIKETAGLLGAWVQWRRDHPAATEAFVSSDFRPKIWHGGFAATIDRWLPMDERGRFKPSS